MPSKILKAVKTQQGAGGKSKFWKPGSTLEQEQPSQQQTQNHDTIEEDSSTSKSPKILSKGVMSMKFMARKVEIADEERAEAKKRRKVLDSGWSNVDTDTPASADDLTITDGTTSSGDHRIVCTIETEDLYASLPGRRSFRGFNNVVERFYQHSLDTQKFGLNKKDSSSAGGVDANNISS